MAVKGRIDAVGLGLWVSGKTRPKSGNLTPGFVITGNKSRVG